MVYFASYALVCSHSGRMLDVTKQFVEIALDGRVVIFKVIGM